MTETDGYLPFKESGAFAESAALALQVRSFPSPRAERLVLIRSVRTPCVKGTKAAWAYAFAIRVVTRSIQLRLLYGRGFIF